MFIDTFGKVLKNNQNTDDKGVREAYGVMSSVAGLIVNFILFLIEIIIGFSINSIAVIADSFHNLSDVTASIITLLGFKLSGKPADSKHPFGHGRIEYLSALMVAALILMVGYEFIRSSILRIANPAEVKFSLVSFLIIIVAVPLKAWLSHFNKSIGKRIDSSALKAAGADAFNDVLILSGIILSLVVSEVFHIDIDGYVGVAVALMIIFFGFSIMKETIDSLLGQMPDPKLVERLKSLTLSYDLITGVHDIVVHNYGPGRSMASLHVEVPSDMPVMAIHDVIDRAEKEISEELNIFVVMHMDPVNVDSAEITKIKEEIESILNKFPEISSFHDFRVVGEGEHKNLIFDIVIPFSLKISLEKQDVLKQKIEDEIKKTHPGYNVIITKDREYVMTD